MQAPPLTLSSDLGCFQALDIVPRSPVANAQLFADVTDGGPLRIQQGNTRLDRSGNAVRAISVSLGPWLVPCRL